jgi:phosphate-selective porin OprO/OprP
MKCNSTVPRAALWLAVAGSLFLGIGPAGAAEQSVVEELLEILREEGKISEEKYRDMKQRYQEEQRAAAAPAPATPAVSAPPADDSESWKVGWKNGLRVERADGYHKLKLGGRLYNDWAAIHEENGLIEKVDAGRNANWITGTELRAARLFLEGTFFERLIFKTEYDFAGGDAEFKDVFVGLTALGPIEKLRFGHYKEPFSLEELTSSRYITFMERSLANVFSPARNTGIGINTTAYEGRMALGLGVFSESDDFGDGFGSRENYDVTARLSGLPLYTGEGEQLVHLGLGYSHQFREEFLNDGSLVRYRQRPEMHMADRLVDTGGLSGVQGVDLFGPEFALVHGPWSVQAEFIGASVQRNTGNPDLWLWGTYVEGSYWFTGEHREYDTAFGAFDRVTPVHSFDPGDGHWGAFQAALRYSYLDLDDSGIDGGREDGVTTGLNWHLFPNARVMLNYVWGRVRGQGSVNGVQTRLQIDF